MSFLSTTGLPPWVIPAAIVHLVLFVVMIAPLWRGFAYARLGGPTALVLAIPLLGLIVVAVLMVAFALRRAGWPVIGVVLLFVPVLNVLYIWMFGYGRWTSERAAIRRRTDEAAVLAASENLIEPSKRVVDGEGGDIANLVTEPGPDEASLPHAADENLEVTEADPSPAQAAAEEATESPAHEVTETPAQEITETSDDTQNAEAAQEAEPAEEDEPAEKAEAVQEAVAAPPPPATPISPPEQDMTFIAGAGNAPAEQPSSWLIRGIDGRSKKFAMRLHEEDLLDADNGILIGRSTRAHFIINDESVSRNHARLVLIKGQLMVEDLDAMNGVWLGKKRIASRTPTPLNVGTEFSIGKVTMRVDPVD
jgi:hypothetical protein